MEQDSLIKYSFTYAPGGIALISAEGYFVRVNPAFGRLLGYTEDELANRQEKQLTSPNDPGVKEAAAPLLEPGAASRITVVKRYLRKDGGKVRVKLEVILIRDQDGAHAGFCAYASEWPEPEEPKMLQAAELYEMVSEHARDVISYGIDSVLQFVSPASLKRQLGFEPEELIGKHASEFIHPEDLESLGEQTFRESDSFICRVRHKQGYYIWFELSVKRVIDPEGTQVKEIYIGRDVSERERAQAALRHSEQNLAQSQRIARLGSFEWDALTGKMLWSDELSRILQTDRLAGVTCEELLARIHPNDREAVRKSMREALAGREIQLESRIVLSDGTVKFIRMQSMTTLTSNGRPLRISGTVQDITGQKLMLQMLEESVDRYTSLKKYNLDAIVSLNKSGIMTSANPAAETITGYSVLELIGMPFTDLLAPEEERAQTLLHKIMHEGALSSMEMKIVRKSGQPAYLLATPAPIYVNRKQVGCYIIAKDITEQKRKDELLLKSEKLTIAGQLAAGVAHEIRNPLTALKGFVQLMGRSEHSYSQYLPIMKEELERIETIISELLMLAKPQAVQMKIADLAVLVQDVVMLTSAQAMLLNIELRFSTTSEPLPIRCDPNQIKQVFVNFLKNAIDAMPRGGMIDVSLEAAEQKLALVCIADQGCGITEEQLRQIGEPFYSTKEAGTGLGLLVSHKIIEHHKGRIHIASEVGVGTTIQVTLPLHR
ncbi:PAS domain-containing protein [Paenibacillus ehimensis]|uniref:histidine kinase n=1 Tax=Paenibacillus ehimensis TaxID=79264 RepID=A0ABT8V8I7_9BACL|nr:PAS domain S-box protein [Paenibacillus ehimensis]MDO3677769.1 PAS domain S-box protein [Paenibacillus ehimensis]